ncbi:site-specific DNA-methyltransferase [Hathewaya massiliensis]|uniref:site-specific DNA-methyltransferase n=1 Tax=Hathewaya massiliensis TaxID=1964382 RepID=UPI00115B6238|nr:site-specific DNA-methyltransferase [Hathewaya massiliensis]
MEKLKMQTKSKVDVNIETIEDLFPNTITERIKVYDENNKPIVEKAIDFDILKQELSKFIVEGKEERYQMNWPGKKEAILRANTPINKTLRPCREESVDFDNTENIYIEGDNLEVLKLLQETYLNKIKMIYIDPPYNTGNDYFVYPDNFAMSSEEFSELSGQYDEDGDMIYDIRKNNESNGKFHTDWLNMMYSRLKLARDLLSEDGVIFISIDDNEVENLKKLCNEVFGEGNFVGEIIRKTKSMTGDNANGFNLQHENLFIYTKEKNNVLLIGKEKRFENYSNPDNDPLGRWCSGDPSAKSGGDTTYFPIKNPYTDRVDYPPKGRFWAFSQNTLERYIAKGKIKFKENYKDGERGFIFKRYKNEASNYFNPVNSLFPVESEFMNQSATIELKSLFDNSVFNYPKPTSLLLELTKCCTLNDNDIILDFFAGSSTTAHAVMQLNAEDGGNRKFIMVQLPEATEEKSEAFKAGYKNICEIGKERIRRAGKKIKEENPDKAVSLDTGFRVLKLDSSNMKDVFYSPVEVNQRMIDKLESNIKGDRSNEDLLFQVMLDLGELLSSDIEEIEIQGKKVFNVGQGNIVACFDNDIIEEVVKEIAKMNPFYAVFRDSCLSNDSVATNFEEIFKIYSPNTIRKIL